MRVPGGDSETMIDDYQAAVACMVLRDGDDSIRSRMYGSAIVRSHIHAGVECSFAAERIQALTKTVGNMPHDRPDRWRVGGVGKAHGGEQMESTAGDGDHRCIAFQESILLDGTVESILGIHWIVGLVECRWMIAKPLGSPGHFGCQGLQGIKALVGVVDGCLQLPVLLLGGLQLMPHRIVVADFPEHPRIRANSNRHRDTTDERQYANTVQHISRYDELPELARRRRDIERVALTPHDEWAP